MNSRLLYIIEKKIAHTKPFTPERRIIEFYRFENGRIRDFVLVIDMAKVKLLDLRHEVDKYRTIGWKTH